MRLGIYEAFQQALIHLKAGRPAEAAGALYLATAAWPDIAELWYLAGCCEEQAGRSGAAADCYRKALKIDPAHPGAGENLRQMALGLFRLGLARETEGATDQAAAAYGEALHLAPDHAEAAERLKRLARARIGEAALDPLAPFYLASVRAEILDHDAKSIGSLVNAGQATQAGLQALRSIALGWPMEADLQSARLAATRLLSGAIEHFIGQGQLDQARALLGQALPWLAGEAAIAEVRSKLVQRYLMQAETRRRAGDAVAASEAFKAILSIAPDMKDAEAALQALLAERAAEAKRLGAAAETADGSGDIDAAVGGFAQAAAVAPDPDPYLSAMTAARYRASSSPRSTLLWPAIGRVEVVREPTHLVIRAAERPAKGWALVSFFPEHVLLDDAYEHFWASSINWESREVCRILLELGYDLHVMHAAGPPPAAAEPYAVAFAFPGEFLRLAGILSERTIRIGLLTGSSPDFLEAREAERIAALLARRPGPYVAKRSGGRSEALDGIDVADRCLLIGNAQTLSTYPDRLQRKIAPIRVSGSPLAYVKGPGDYVPREREFLWYFGHGAVLKGLDLLLEIFARQQAWTLNVVGLVLDEPDFLALYGQELFRHPRIRFHGHLRGNATELARIHRRSIAFVAPSASEGMSNACATCLTAGLYPIISRTTGIDLPRGLGIYLEDCSMTEIESAIARVHAMDDAALARDIEALQAHARDAYSRETYAREMRRELSGIVAAGRTAP